MEYEQPDAKRCWDDNGILIGGIDYHIANGWRFRAEPRSICERYTQLIDPNGCPLLDGFMMEPQVACESLNAGPAEASLGVEVAYLALRERLQAIIDWADFALANPSELDKGGVKNLSGPVFDEARAALAQKKQGDGE